MRARQYARRTGRALALGAPHHIYLVRGSLLRRIAGELSPGHLSRPYALASSPASAHGWPLPARHLPLNAMRPDHLGALAWQPISINLHPASS